MRCPECGKKMEGEFCPYVIEIKKGATYEDIPKVRKAPSTHYRCDNCDSEWVKVSRGILRMLDGAQPLRRRIRRDDSEDRYDDQSQP